MHSRCPKRTAPEILLVAAAMLAGAAAALAQEKKPLPDAAAQKHARELLRDLYGQEREAAKTSAEKTELAKKLLDQAAKTQDDPASHFVLLQTAKDVAADAGDAETALEAVGQIVRAYQVDPIEMQLDCVQALAKAAKLSSQRVALAEQAFALVDEAVAEDKFEAAARFAEIARDSALRARKYALSKEIATRMKEVEELRGAHAEYRNAIARLEENPTDPDANLTAGRYLCLAKGDWDRGIPMLALGSDAALKAVAAKDLKGATTPEARAALADNWWELAQTKEGEEKHALLLRAGEWYEEARPEVTGLAKVRLQNRLDEIGKIQLPKTQPAKTTSPQQAKSDAAFEVKSGVHFIRQAKRGLWVRIFASGCNGHQVYLNGRPLMKCSRDEAATAAAILKEGDVLAVKLGDRFDVMSHWMMFLTREGEYLFQTSDKWTAYLPLDKQRWWDVRNIRPGPQNAQYAPDSRQYVDRVKKAAQQAVPHYPKSQPVYSPLMGEDRYGDAYLYYVVTVEDLLPKKLRSQPAPDLRSAGATPKTGTTAASDNRPLPTPMLRFGPAPKVKPFDPATAELLGVLDGHRDYVQSLAFSPDGAILLCGGRSEPTVKLWDMASGSLRGTIGPPPQTLLAGKTYHVHALAINADGSILAWGGGQPWTVKLWNPLTGDLRQAQEQQTADIQAVAVSPDGSIVATAGGDKTVRLWDGATGRLQRTLDGTERVLSLAFSPDGSLLVSGEYRNKLMFWDVSSGELQHTLAGPSYVGSLAFTRDGSVLASSHYRNVVLWDVAARERRRQLGGYTTSPTCVAFHPDGSILATCGGAVKLWDVGTGDLRRTLEGFDKPPRCVAFSPDGTILAVGDRGTVKLWGERKGNGGERKRTRPERVRTR